MLLLHPVQDEVHVWLFFGALICSAIQLVALPGLAVAGKKHFCI